MTRPELDAFSHPLEQTIIERRTGPIPAIAAALIALLIGGFGGWILRVKWEPMPAPVIPEAEYSASKVVETLNGKGFNQTAAAVDGIVNHCENRHKDAQTCLLWVEMLHQETTMVPEFLAVFPDQQTQDIQNNQDTEKTKIQERKHKRHNEISWQSQPANSTILRLPPVPGGGN